MKKILLSLYVSPLFAVLIQPPDGSELSYIHVLFQWEEVENTNSFEFLLLDQNSNIILDTTITELYYINKNDIDWNSEYFWEIKPSGDNWSEQYSFRTTSTLSNVDILLNDPNNYSNGYTIFGNMENQAIFTAIIDKNGKEIWNSGNIDLVYYNFSVDGNYYGCLYHDKNDNPNFLQSVEFSLFNSNKITWEVPNDYNTHHEIIKLP